MSWRIITVELSDGSIVFLRVQTAGEYLDMQAELEALDPDGTGKSAKIKEAFAIKMSRTLCNESGDLSYPTSAADPALLELYVWTDAKKIVEQVNRNNGFDDKSLAATEKK
jgi:hypothetical protein